jgi:hypothetical protein
MGAIDVFAEYIYRIFIRLLLFVESFRWAKVEGFVLDCSVKDSPIGCDLVTIRYRVGSEPDPWIAAEEIPFLSPRDANWYARKCVVNRRLRIRVHPTYATETHFFEFDQK